MQEIWKDIHGFEGYYQVSDQGRVKSVERVIEYSDGRGRTQKERILKANPDGGGYLIVGLNKEGKRNTKTIHRLVSIAFIPNPENKYSVDHRNGNKTDNRVDNLRWGTREEQMQWAHHEQGLGNPPKGEINGKAKLTETDVISIILTLKDTNTPMKNIASDCGVIRQTISCINTGKSWSHVLPEISRPIR